MLYLRECECRGQYNTYDNIFVASLDETEMISYDTQCASAATADTLK